MLVRAFVGGPGQVVGYLVYDQKAGHAAIIDTPAGTLRQYLAMLKDFSLTLDNVINTHGHWDHIAENAALVRATGATLCAHTWDAARLADPSLTMEPGTKLRIAPSKADKALSDGALLNVGDVRLEIWHTPGHSPGSVCLYARDAGVIFTGDTLLRVGVGRTNLPGGSSDRLAQSLCRLASLPDDTRVYPGRGLPTTIKNERWLLDLAAT